MQTVLPIEDTEPNDNFTMPAGPIELVRQVFNEFGLIPILSGMKREQEVSVAKVTEALVAHTMEMEGLNDDVDKNDLHIPLTCLTDRSISGVNPFSVNCIVKKMIRTKYEVASYTTSLLVLDRVVDLATKDVKNAVRRLSQVLVINV